MKKIVFLFMLVICFTPTDVHGETRRIECNGALLEVDNTLGDIVVRKLGLSPFETEISNPEEFYRIRDVLCTDDLYYFYGFSHLENGETYYDIYLLILDNEGNIILEDKTDYGMLEEIMGVYIVDDILITHIRQNEDVNRDYYYMNDLFVAYDLDYNQSNRLVYEYEVVTGDVINDVLFVRHGYSDVYDMGIKSDLTTLLEDDVFSIESSYIGEFKLRFLNEGILNDEPVENGVLIDYPGNYIFEYNNTEYEFTVDPLIQGVVDKGVYYEAVTINVSGGNVLVNNEPYINGEVLSVPGNYVLQINGAKDYIKEIEFMIVPKVEGVIDGHSYEDEVSITFEGEGFINNNSVVSPLLLNEDGDYIFRVKGVNGYMDTYQFSIVSYDDGFEIRDIIKNIDIFIMIVVVSIGIIIIKKK